MGVVLTEDRQPWALLLHGDTLLSAHSAAATATNTADSEVDNHSLIMRAKEQRKQGPSGGGSENQTWDGERKI